MPKKVKSPRPQSHSYCWAPSYFVEREGRDGTQSAKIVQVHDALFEGWSTIKETRAKLLRG